MLAIKLQRIGKKHQPSYRVVVAEKKSKMAAPPVEDLGSYSAETKKAHVKTDRVAYWIGVGAQPTPTVHNLLVREGVLKASKIQLNFKKPAEKPVEAAALPASPEKLADKATEAPTA